MIRKLEYTVEDDFAGRQVLEFLKAHNFSSRTIKDLKKNPHGILIGNKKVTVLRQLRRGDRLTVYIKDGNDESVKPVNLPLDILYEDRDVVVCNKAPFMATHPSQDNYDNTLANALCYHFAQNGDSCLVRCVNRLDKNTSGAILIAKNAHACSVLSGDLREKRIRRNYLAFVEGCPEPTEGTVCAPIARKSGSAIKRCVDFERGDSAVTHYQVLKIGGFSLLRLWLETGRTHQIRVHMAHIGHPVAGDFLYGTEFSGGIARHALHSASIDFTHPITGQEMHFDAPLAQDMITMYQQLWGDFDETAYI